MTEFAFRWGLVAVVMFGISAQHARRVDAAPSVVTASGTAASVDPVTADIQGVFAWMSPDATRANLVMTLSPFDDGSSFFASNVQYVFHVSTYQAFGQEPVGQAKVICQFESSSDVECWVGNAYLRGNPSSTTGLISANGLIKVFAGRRSDPMAFNSEGFDAAMQLLRDYSPPGNASRCPSIPPSTATQILHQLANQPPPNFAVADLDPFRDSNVLAIVLQVDKRLLSVTSSASLLSVWGSTHRR